MSLLTIIQNACAEMNLVQPSAVISSTDQQVQQLLRLADKEGKELARRFNWQRLITEGNFPTLAQTTQVASISNTFSDFGRYIPDTMFNRTTQMRVLGPLNSIEWQAKQASGLNAMINNFFRIRGNAILFYPAPEASEEIYFEYVSNTWCISANSDRQSSWVADADTALIDEEVVTQGVIWRFLKAKGLDYSEEFATYERTLEQLFGADGARTTFDLTGDSADWFSAHISEGDWPEA
jgi:hypothetical protein